MQDIKDAGHKKRRGGNRWNTSSRWIFLNRSLPKGANDTIKSKELPNSCFCLFTLLSLFSPLLKTQKPKLTTDKQFVSLGFVGKRRLERPTPTSRT